MSDDQGTEAAARARAIDAIVGAGVAFQCTEDYWLAVERMQRLIVEHERALAEVRKTLATTRGERDKYRAALQAVQEPCDSCDGLDGRANCPSEELHAIADEALDEDPT